MSAFDLASAFAAVTDVDRPHVLGSYAADGPCMLGVVTFPAGSRDGFWERHDGGDELLVVVRGRVSFTIHLPDGTRETRDVGPGQVLHIPRGAAHSARILEEVHVLFVTPRQGNTVWSEPSEPSRAL